MQFSSSIKSSGNINVDDIMRILVETNELNVAIVHDFLIEKFDEPKKGKPYMLPDGTKYTASAPGEYPARKTGNLAGSMYMSDTTVKNGTVQTSLSTDVDYAFDLEGVDEDYNPYTDKLGVRPWMGRAVTDPDVAEKLASNVVYAAETLFEQWKR